ncbi:hypothetical protein SEPCBS57363_003140 [Sporothrix epigloea]|uniref:LrgB-like protein n=1 Tax=Sporothrix epigloea TaxID=1892477 RepID=A0ABP0DJU8_9PEZI
MTISHGVPPSLGSILQQHRQTYYDGCAAVGLFFVWQLLIVGLQQMTASIDNFPAPILAMMLVAAIMIFASKFVANLDGFYQRYLRAPTDLLNRHMSIGFIVPFTMIMKGPMSSSRSIGLIIAGYIFTGILNTFLVFALSHVVQTALLSIRKKHANFDAPRNNDEDGLPRGMSPSAVSTLQGNERNTIGKPFTPLTLLSPGQISFRDLSPLPPVVARGEPTVLGSNAFFDFRSSGHVDIQRCVQPLGILHVAPALKTANSDPEKAKSCQTPIHVLYRLACFAAANPILCCSFTCIPVVGVPVSLSTHNDTALDIFLLVFLWTGTLAAQAAIRRTSFSFWTSSASNQTRARNVLATLLNAVLWSSLGTIVYLVAKAAARHDTIDNVLAQYSTGATLTDLIAGTGSSTTTTLGAGDLASAILDAGIVSWGLKLFDCRAQLLSRAGLTNLVVGAVIAMGNILCGPLLVHSMGLAPPAKQLAFAARSVTLALAGPAMTNLGGDVGLNAAMVVFNGIVFQLAMGLGVCRWAPRLLAAKRKAQPHAPKEDVPDSDFRCRMGSHSCSLADSGTDVEICADVVLPRATEADLLPSSASSTSSSAPSQQLFSNADKPVSPTQYLVSQSASHSHASRSNACFVRLSGADAHTPETPDTDTPATVAAGMTVGINAAAMGTAYLYEDGSRAAPYAALSMTVFGVMTVVFTSIQPLAAWVVSHTV